MLSEPESTETAVPGGDGVKVNADECVFRRETCGPVTKSLVAAIESSARRALSFAKIKFCSTIELVRGFGGSRYPTIFIARRMGAVNLLKNMDVISIVNDLHGSNRATAWVKRL